MIENIMHVIPVTLIIASSRVMYLRKNFLATVFLVRFILCYCHTLEVKPEILLSGIQRKFCGVCSP